MRRGSRDLERHPEGPGLWEDPSPFGGAGQARVQRRDRLLAGVFAVGVHLIVLAMLFWPHARPAPAKPPLSSILVSVADVPTPEPPGPPNADVAPGAQDKVVRLTPPHLAPVSEPADTPAPDNSDLLSDSQLAGAASAGEEGAGGGGGAGGCNMARLVQQALRHDSLVRMAVEDANRLGKATMLWNGDWVRSGSQDGKGLSAVRQAIMWEVGFAPEACRNQRMHGLVLLSLADGGTRFAIGSGEWRWSDLLGVGVGVRGLPPDR
jgi:hypothetical protein